MNELEKEPLQETGSVPVDPVTPQDKASCGEENNAIENECAEKESPAMDLAEAADAIMEEEGAQETAAKEQTPSDKTLHENVNYHAMTKEELRDSLKNILESGNMEMHKDVTAIKQAFYALHNREMSEELNAFVEAGNSPEAFSATPDAVENEVKELLTQFRERRNQYLEEKEEERRKNLEEKRRIIEAINSLSEDIDNINLQFPKFQQLQQDFKAAGEVPAGADTEIWKSYQLSVEQFYDRLKMNKELRDLDFRKNLEVKKSLLEKAKSLGEMEDPVAAIRALQSLHVQWRETGPVAKELREDLWNEFKEASTIVNKRHQEFFQQRKANESANEEAKTLLCEKAEQIANGEFKTFADWDEATKQIIALQQEWKGLGFASRKVNNQLFAKFRKICDDFFTAKAEYFKKTKEENKENLQKKEALCEKAEALVEKFNEKGALQEIQNLQKEWRTIGVVRRKAGDEVWKRFCNAIDAFYAARKKQFSGKREEENTNLAAKKEIIAKLKEISDDAERSEVISTIRELQNTWQSTGHVPFKEKDAVNSEYRAELDRLYKAFDMRENRQRLSRYENEVRKMDGDETKLGREREKLMRAIEARQSELQTIENNLGFFKFNNASGNPMQKEFEKRIERLKEEISQIKEKIKLLDNPSSAKPTEQEETSKDEEA